MLLINLFNRGSNEGGVERIQFRIFPQTICFTDFFAFLRFFSYNTLHSYIFFRIGLISVFSQPYHVYIPYIFYFHLLAFQPSAEVHLRTELTFDPKKNEKFPPLEIQRDTWRWRPLSMMDLLLHVCFACGGHFFIFYNAI